MGKCILLPSAPLHFQNISFCATKIRLKINYNTFNNKVYYFCTEPEDAIMYELSHKNYNANNLTATIEYGTISYTDNTAADGTSGYYLDVGYNVSEMVGCEGKLIPWFRYGNVQKDVDDSSSHYDAMKFGLSYFPINQIAFKIDYGTKIYENEDNNKILINIGVGYMF